MSPIIISYHTHKSTETLTVTYALGIKEKNAIKSKKMKLMMGNISSEHILYVNRLLHSSEINWKQDKKGNKDCLC